MNLKPGTACWWAQRGNKKKLQLSLWKLRKDLMRLMPRSKYLIFQSRCCLALGCFETISKNFPKQFLDYLRFYFQRKGVEECHSSRSSRVRVPGVQGLVVEASRVAVPAELPRGKFGVGIEERWSLLLGKYSRIEGDELAPTKFNCTGSCASSFAWTPCRGRVSSNARTYGRNKSASAVG